MRVDPLSTRAYFGPEQTMTGVSHALAEARKTFRAAASDVSWGEVMAEATRVRAKESLSLLDALAVVHQRLTVGAWSPQTASAASL